MSEWREEPAGSFSSRFQEEPGTGGCVDASNAVNACQRETLTGQVGSDGTQWC